MAKALVLPPTLYGPLEFHSRDVSNPLDLFNPPLISLRIGMVLENSNARLSIPIGIVFEWGLFKRSQSNSSREAG